MFSVEDVVTASTGGLTGETSGDGDQKPFAELFG